MRISFLSTTMELYRSIHEMFEPSLLGYSTGSQMPLDIPLRKTNTGERLSFERLSRKVIICTRFSRSS